jgi:hypothetical protein
MEPEGSSSLQQPVSVLCRHVGHASAVDDVNIHVTLPSKPRSPNWHSNEYFVSITVQATCPTHRVILTIPYCVKKKVDEEPQGY